MTISGNEIFSGQIGTEADILSRLISQLPNWFGTDYKNLETLLFSYVSTGVFNFDQLFYVFLQMRLQSATDINLDNISKDYLGDEIPRRVGETDDLYRKRIEANLLKERATRNGMSNALYLLTGYYPKIFEPWNLYDCGGYNCPSSLAYSTQGMYGSSSYAYQCFIDVYVSKYVGIANYSGYNDYYFGYNAYGAPAIGWYAGESIQTSIVEDQDIYQTINLTKCEGTICWVNINRI